MPTIRIISAWLAMGLWSIPTLSSSIQIDLDYFPERFDPGANMTNTGWYVLNSTSITLFDMAEDQSLQGVLAKTWRSFDDGKRYEVEIHLDAKFHNGRKITAEDVVFSLKRKQKIWPDYQLFDWVDPRKDNAIRILDNNKIEFNLNAPYQYFLFILALPGTGIVPADVYPLEVPLEADKTPILGGPYRIAEIRPGEYLRLEWFEGWMNPRGSRAQTIHIYEKKRHEAAQRFLAGKTDVFMDKIGRLVTMDNYQTELKEKFRSFYPLYNTVWFAYLNATEGPFKDLRTRQAFAAALRSIRQKGAVYPGVRIPATQLFPPGYSGQIDIQLPEAEDFSDLYEKWRESPLTLRYLYADSWDTKNQAHFIEALAEFGFQAEFVFTSEANLMSFRNEGRGYDFSGWFIPMPPGDPSMVFRIDFGKNDFYVPDPNDGRVYKMIEEMKRSGNQAQRIEMAREINRYLVEECLIVPQSFASMPFYGRSHIDFSQMPRWQFNVKFSDIHLQAESHE